MPQVDIHSARSQNIESSSQVPGLREPQEPETMGQGVGKDTYRGTAGDTTTAEEELIFVYNYGGVPATQRQNKPGNLKPV